MEGYVLMGTLAAFGLLCAMWALAGWLLPGDRNGVAVFFCGKGDNRLPPLPRWRLLRQLGLLRCRVIVVDCGLTEADRRELSRWNTEICGPEALAERLELERKRFDGTGNGDPSGHDQCRGISEL